MTSDAGPDAASPPPPVEYRFGRFVLDPARRTLSCEGAPVELQPKVFDFIAYLLAHRDRAVDKNELLDAVWPRQVVTEAALSRCVMKARRALQDEADRPEIILTVHGRGFRFMAPVVEAAAGAAGAEAALPAPTEPTPAETAPAMSAATTTRLGARRAPGWAWLAAAALAMAVAIGAWWSQHAPADPGPTRIAVLPLRNDTGDARYDWATLGLSNGVGEILRSQGASVVDARDLLDLAQGLPALDDRQRLQRLREALGASHVVAARLAADGGRLRLNYSVLGPEGDSRRRTVVGADIGQLAQAMAADLHVSFHAGAGAAAVPGDAFANEAYLRGRALRLQGDVAGALRYFKLALEQAPTAFWPRLEIATATLELGDGAAAQAQLVALLAEADAAGDRRQRIAVRNALGVLYWRIGPEAKAGPLLRESLALAEHENADTRVSALSRLGIWSTYQRDYAAAHRYLERAVAEQARAGWPQPAGELRNSQAQLALREGDLASAGVHLEAALAQFRLVGNRRNEAIALNGLAALRRRQGRFEEARDLVAHARDLHRALGNRSGELSATIGLAIAEAELGRLRAASEDMRQARALAQALGEDAQAATADSLLGQFALDLGELDRARAHLQSALDFRLGNDDPHGALRERLYLAQVTERAGDADAALEQTQAVLAALGEDAPAPLRVDALGQAARQARQGGDLAQAQRWLDQALALATPMGDDRRLARVHMQRAELALAMAVPTAAGASLEAAAAELANDPDFLRVRAAWLAATGDADGALRAERAAKAAAGERWRPEDEARLRQRGANRG